MSHSFPAVSPFEPRKNPRLDTMSLEVREINARLSKKVWDAIRSFSVEGQVDHGSLAAIERLEQQLQILIGKKAL